MAQAPISDALEIASLRLSDGRRVRVRMAFTSQGPIGAPTYLLLHGYTGSHLALAMEAAAADSGWASAWAGPGLALDTREIRVLTVNLPGSSYGSQWEGADDAYATIEGMAWAIDAWLEDMGVGRLEGAIGYSFGGYVALGLRAWHPARLSRALAICSAARGRGSLAELDALRSLDTPERRFTWRMDNLARAGLLEWSQEHGPQALEREREAVRRWAGEVSAASLWRLRAAAATFELPQWPARSTALYASSDLLFPPAAESAPEMHTVQTRYGHQSLLLDPKAWCEPIGHWVHARQPFHSTTETLQDSP